MFKNIAVLLISSVVFISVLSAGPVCCQGLTNSNGTRGDGTSGNGTSGNGTLIAQNGASSSSSRAVHEMIYQAVAAQGVPGYAIAILKDGNVVFRATYGLADVDAQKKVDKDTVFGLASVTKTFTGLALMHLMDEGKISANDTLDKYLKNLPSSWQKLTICQLASMSAGLPKSRGDELPWPAEMAYLKSQPLAYAPGTSTLYSNPGFRILGSVIETVTGMPYLDYINQTILQPLGMTATGTTESLAAAGHVSRQYIEAKGFPQAIKAKDPETAFAAGMLASSLNDMCIYAEALLEQKLISKAAYKRLFIERPPLASGKAVNWAYGWAANYNKQLGQKVNIMNGGLPGVASTVMLVPDLNMAVVALSNLRTEPVYAIPKRALHMYLTGQDLGEPSRHSGADGEQTSGQSTPQNNDKDASNNSGGP